MTQKSLSKNPLGDWEFFTLKDACEKRPEPTYVVEDLLRVPSLSIFFGTPQTFKSMLLADMAACVVAGEPWLRAETPDDKEVERATTKGAVMICDFDNGSYLTHSRVAALARARGVPEDPSVPFRYVSMPDTPLDASKREHTQALATRLEEEATVFKEIEEEKPFKLLIIDNLRLISGSIDENNSEMSTVMRNLRDLAEDIDAAVVVIHHQRKEKRGSSRPGDSLRGHSSIEASLDLAVRVDKEEDLAILTPIKMRSAPIERFAARFTYKHRNGSKELEVAKFVGLRADNVGKTGQVRRAILAVVEHKPGINQGELHVAVKERVPTGASLEDVRANVTSLEKEGRLVRRKGKVKNAWLHFPPGEDSGE